MEQKENISFFFFLNCSEITVKKMTTEVKGKRTKDSAENIAVWSKAK
jgi:hypothetical protein